MRNLGWLDCQVMITVHWERYPLVGQHAEARRWLQFTANIGRARNTVEAYGRAVDNHLAFCLTFGAAPERARPDAVAAWIGDTHQRPNPNGGVGLANSTIQVRIVGVRSFYDFLVEEGVRERNPVRRGQSSRRGARPKQGLVRRVDKAPWIPNEHAWDRILRACERETVRNRLMVTFAYDGALRREELVSLEPGDLEPAWSLIHLRAETTKSKRFRGVSFGTTSVQLLVAYLRQRGETIAVSSVKSGSERPGITRQGDTGRPATGHALHRSQRRLQLSPVRENPLVCGTHGSGGTRVPQTDHRDVSCGCACLDPAPAAVLPPQDRLHHSTTINRAVGVTHQAQATRRRGQIADCRAKIKILPAHVRHVMDTSARRGHVPIEEGDRQQLPHAVSIHGVLG